MSRWRPPAPQSTAIITAQGLRALQDELDRLWRHRRPAVVRALAAAAAEGDRSENAEYQYRKKELAGIDRRVRYLSKRIPALRVAPKPSRQDKVFFQARVTLHDLDNDQRQHWHIVGPDEADPSTGAISIDAPLARALLGKQVDDEIEVQLPEGSRQLRIESIDYQDK